MDKKDILEKAKKENQYGDEMYNYIYFRGARLAMTIALAMCCIIAFIDMIIHSGSFTILGRAMFIVQLSMQSTLYGFLAIKCKRGTDIACFVLDILALIAFLISTIIYLLNLV